MLKNLTDSPTLLLVEDDASAAFTIAQQLTSKGYRVKTAGHAADAIRQVRDFPEIDLVLMDLNLGQGMDGAEAAQIILRERDLPVVFLLEPTEQALVEKAEKITAYGYVVKGTSSSVLLASIKLASRLHAANSRLAAREILVESEARYRLLLHSGNDAIFVHSIGPEYRQNKFMEVNQKSCEMLGYEPEELLSLSPLDISVPGETDFLTNLGEELSRSKRAVFEMSLRRKDGSLIETELSSHLIETGHALEVLSIARDITARKKAEQSLRKSEEKFRLIWTESPIAKELYDARGQLVDLNPACLSLFGVDRLEDVRGFQLFEDPNITQEVKERLLAGQSVKYESEFDFDKIHTNHLYPTRKRGLIDISVQVTPLPSNGVIAGYLVQVHDETLRKQAEAALERALGEKSMLLSDLQHRIKNSLALIASLIVLGQNNARGDEAKYALEELYSRVIALAGLYDVLYGSNDANEIRLDAYLQQIAESLAASYLHQEKGIELSITCEQILVEARLATPFGLILNELLTNALKYAFPEDQGGVIRVVLRRAEPDLVELVVSNDGRALPENFDLQHSSGLGLQIVQMLVGQLEGTITCQCNGQTSFLVQVPFKGLSQ